MEFTELKLMPQLLEAVKKAGYTTPSPIQQKAIPPVLAGRDLLGCAQTGTGKTAAFALPMLQLLHGRRPAAGGRPIRALVLTPTRELALQIFESFEAYGGGLSLRCAVIFGGVGQGPQVQALQRGVDILVATPGRLNDLIGQGYIKLGNVEIFVLDEADRMLDMGFVNDVKKVIKQLPKQRQTLLFSATMPKEIVQLAAGLLNNPAKVFVTPPATTVEKIDQSLYRVDKANKRHLLAQLLQGEAVASALVFTRTKHGADRVVRELKKEGIAALAIHGNKSQNARQNALSLFKKGKVKVLVATDIAARGLDISELSHVFNYDLPNVPETYVHRIGRTGRAGHDGIAVSFCCADEEECLRDIQKLIGFSIPEVRRHPWPLGTAPPKEPAGAKQSPAPGRAAPAAQKAAAPKPPPRPEPRRTQAAPAPKPTREKARQQPVPRPRGAPAGRPAPEAEPNRAAAIVTKRPPWSDNVGAAPQTSTEGALDMSRNNRRRRSGKKRPDDQPAAPQPAREKKPNPVKKNERGVFDFTEEELAEDNSLRLINAAGADGEAKYASFEDYLKDH